MRFESFDEAAFEKALQEKDYNRLKINTISAIRNDPAFRRDEIKLVLKTLKDRCPEIFEDYRCLDYEEKKPNPSTWDSRYFTACTFCLKDNFSMERIERICEIGRTLYPKETQRATPTEEGTHREKSDAMRQNVPPLTAPERRYNLLIASVAVAAVLVLILVITNLLQ